MTAEINASPRLPLPFKLQAIAKSLRPLIKSGALYMTPKQVPFCVNCIKRWGFAVGGLITMSAHRYPDRLALVDDQGELTYSELRDQAWALARALKDRGMGSHSRFGVVARNGRGIILPMAVKGLLGAEIMIMNIGSSAHQISGLLNETKTDYLFIDEEFLDRVPEDIGDCTIVVTHVSDPDNRPELPDNYVYMQDLIDADGTSELEERPDQGRIIIMSSGTTGIPKGVLRNEPKTPATLGAITDRIPWRRNMVIHQSASMFHAWGWANVIIAMVTGATLVTQRQFEPKKALELFDEYGVNGLVSAAIFLRILNDYLEENPRPNPGPFEFMISSGNAIPAWLVTALTERFGPVVCNFYGSTEAGLTSIATGPELAERPDSAGRPAIGARVLILDDDDNEVAPGEVGRIHTAQELSFTGYLAAGRDKFRTFDGLLEIGDLGRIDEDGFLYVCGRSDDMVIKGGENTFPREVDEVLGALDGVEDLHTVGVNNTKTLLAELHTFVIRKKNEAGEALDPDEMRQIVRDNLAEHSVPEHIHFVDDLPRNATGKVVPRLLPVPDQN